MAVLVKEFGRLAFASAKTRRGLALASANTVRGLDVTAGGGGGSFTLLSSATGSFPSLNTTGADLLIAVVGFFANGGGGNGGITDSLGNTWNTLTSQTGTVGLTILWCIPTSTSATHGFSRGGTDSGDSALVVAAFSGAHASPFDAIAGAKGTGATLQPGSLTPANANSLVVTAAAANFTTISSVDSPFSITLSTGTTYRKVAVGFEIQTSPTARNPTWTFAAGGNQQAAMTAAFRAA